MKKPKKPFTREEVIELFDVEGSSPSGLAWRINYRHHKPGDPAGYSCPRGTTENCGTVWHVCFNGRPHLVHRIIWVIENGEIPKGLEIDHINGDASDNRIGNLSLKTRDHNTRARVKKSIRNTSGHTGVQWSKQAGKWKARCFRNYKEHHLGFYDDKEEAARAVDAFAQKWADDHGEEFRLHNFKN